MDNFNKPINFSLNRINTIQFAVLEDCFVEGKSIDLTTSVNFGIGKDEHVVASLGTFTLEIEQKPFLKLEISCEFNIDNESWASFLSADNKSIHFPKGLMIHLTTIMVGTARGILHAKTENTIFNKFPLPTINVTELVTNDVVVEF
jgi:hypothetical protein